MDYLSRAMFDDTALTVVTLDPKRAQMLLDMRQALATATALCKDKMRVRSLVLWDDSMRVFRDFGDPQVEEIMDGTVEWTDLEDTDFLDEKDSDWESSKVPVCAGLAHLCDDGVHWTASDSGAGHTYEAAKLLWSDLEHLAG